MGRLLDGHRLCPILSHAEFGRSSHREDAAHFNPRIYFWHFLRSRQLIYDVISGFLRVRPSDFDGETNCRLKITWVGFWVVDFWNLASRKTRTRLSQTSLIQNQSRYQIWYEIEFAQGSYCNCNPLWPRSVIQFDTLYDTCKRDPIDWDPNQVCAHYIPIFLALQMNVRPLLDVMTIVTSKF